VLPLACRYRVPGERLARRRDRGVGDGRVSRKGLPALTSPSMLMVALGAELLLLVVLMPEVVVTVPGVVVGEALVDDDGDEDGEGDDVDDDAEDADPVLLLLLGGVEGALVLVLGMLLRLLDP
jgi:hypothetical protein